MYKKIIPVFVSIAMLWGLFSFSAAATGVERSQTTTGFGSYLLNLFTSWQKENPDAPPSEYDGFGRGGGFESSYMGNWHSDTATCPSSEAPGGYHYIDPDVPSCMSGFGSEGTNWEFCCLYCHEYFTVTGDSLSEAYKDYVDTFPVPGINSSGSLIWYTTWNDYFAEPDLSCSIINLKGRDRNASFDRKDGSFSDSNFYHFSIVDDHTLFIALTSSLVDPEVFILYDNFLKAPVSGYYSAIPNFSHSVCYYLSGGIEQTYVKSDSSIYLTSKYCSAGSFFQLLDGKTSYVNGQKLSRASDSRNYLYTLPIVISPDDQSIITNYYPGTSRPTFISGNYGIIGDNGQITKVDSTTIINETNNTYTNPSTGTTSTITEWTYDYSDRSYNVTLESGDTITVTYGDEYITILEGDTTYNVYYIVEGSGDSGENPGTDTCKHDYTSTTDREATCTVPGQMTYTCSLCGDSYEESIPAKGHTWTVLQTVTTEYDQEGNLLQQGYTIYQCSVCGEQYKDEAGTGPPSSGGGAGTDGDSVWDKLGEFLGTIFGGLINVIGAVLGAILDALSSLATMIADKLAAVVALILSFFEEIPKLFSGFLGFLTAVFPFLPEDVMLLLTFGIAVLVFIGIIKALRR